MNIKYHNRIYKVERVENQDSISAYIDNNLSEINLQKDSNGFYSIVRDGKRQKIVTASDSKHIYVFTGNEYYRFDKQGDEFGADSNEIINTSNHELVTSPTPGNIVKILVTKNELIEEGTPLIIIESMKMETTLYSSISGQIKDIFTENGAQVSENSKLIEIEKPVTL